MLRNNNLIEYMFLPCFTIGVSDIIYAAIIQRYCNHIRFNNKIIEF